MVINNMFITFEGGEGCGKSTHAKLLKKYLENKGYKVVLTFEPGGTPFGRKLRKILLKGVVLASSYSELFLFAADRAEHIEKVVHPALRSGKIVISDRFIDSTMAYQVGGRKLPKGFVEKVNNISSSGIMPDLTFLLEVSPKIGMKRVVKRAKKDKFESENGGFHARIRKVYLNIARTQRKRVKLILSVGKIGDVQRKIRDIVDEKLRNKG